MGPLQWQVTRVSGLTCPIRNQVSGENKIIQRDHVKIIDPSIVWDELPLRPKRSRRTPVWDAPRQLAQNATPNLKDPPQDPQPAPDMIIDEPPIMNMT